MSSENFRRRLLEIQKILYSHKGEKLTRINIMNLLAEDDIETNAGTIDRDIEALIEYMPITRTIEKRRVVYYYIGISKDAISEKQETLINLQGHPCSACTATRKSDDCQCVKWKRWWKNGWKQIHRQGMEMRRAKIKIY